MIVHDKIIRIIGVPMDLGQTRRGVDMGPSVIRYADLALRLEKLGYIVKDMGDLKVTLRSTLPKKNGNALLAAIKKACRAAYQVGLEAVERNEIPIFLGGDHSIAVGTVGGITHQQRKGVLWVDAHGDFNTPQTSISGNVHGMSLALLLGKGEPKLLDIGRKGAKLRSEDVVLIGVRELDTREKKALKDSNITVFTMRDIDEQGMGTIMRHVQKKFENLAQIHVSLDMDSLDPMIAPGVGTPSQGGLTYREAQLIMEMAADTGKVASMDIVEINPVMDQVNQTAKVAVELAASLFGKSIM
jgi:arginase